MLRLQDLESWIEYDKPLLATGAKPVIPPIPGVDKKNVFTFHGIYDAEGIKTILAEHKARDVVIVGGGLIGVEVTGALVTHGCRVTIMEMISLRGYETALILKGAGFKDVKVLEGGMAMWPYVKEVG